MTGLIIGKFCPPHKGHRFLIDTALAECDALTVLVCDSAADPIPADLRLAWLGEMYPQVRFLRLFPDRFERNVAQNWADASLAVVGAAPDIIFSSEDYGELYAELLGCRHRMVDKERVAVPVSGSGVLAEPEKHSHLVEAAVASYILGTD